MLIKRTSIVSVIFFICHNVSSINSVGLLANFVPAIFVPSFDIVIVVNMCSNAFPNRELIDKCYHSNEIALIYTHILNEALIEINY